MRMTDLARYGFPSEIIEFWRKEEGESLLPLQTLAVQEHDLFGGGNLLFRAPTSSGKTFLGEMAAVRAALARKKVVYLVPLKALAGEKCRDFQAKYGRYGMNVIVSSRDHREFDGAFEAGAFSIAVVVYEKMAQLLVRRPERLEEIGLVIADELELLSDPERGAQAEWLLTHVLRRKRRLIGLSAVLGQAGRLAAWMDASLVEHDQRPVELRHGVIRDGVFRYRTSNAPGETEEPAATGEHETERDIVAANVQYFAHRGESCLVFLKSRHESRQAAELLANVIEAPAAETAIDALRVLESTHCRDSLLETLNRGVAFHNADLTPGERGVVEAGFRAGEIRVLAATSTLAQGLNLPARNVFIPAEKWRFDRRVGAPWKAPISRAEYENMSGRAGRFGAGHAFGRALLAAPTAFDEETLWRRYVEGRREAIEPQLGREALHDHVARLVAAQACVRRDDLVDFFEHTLTGCWTWRETPPPDSLEYRVSAALQRTIDAAMVAQDSEGLLTATALGRAVAAKGLAIVTAEQLIEWLLVSQNRVWSSPDLLLAVLLTPCGRQLHLPLTLREYEHGAYIRELKRLASGEPLDAATPLNRLRQNSVALSFEEARAIKTTLLLEQWIALDALYAIEEDFGVLSGQIVAAADHAAWLIDAASALAGALGIADNTVARIRELGERVQHGVDDDALPIARLRLPSLTRGALIGLVNEGLHIPTAITACDPQRLRARMREDDVHALIVWAQTYTGPEENWTAGPRTPALVIDDGRPGEIRIDGETIALQEKQYRLMRVLAQNPGVCVSYDALYAEIWGDAVVESGQIHFQKGRLLKRIAEKCPARKTLIRTVPKRGAVLDLPPGDVVVDGEQPQRGANATATTAE